MYAITLMMRMNADEDQCIYAHEESPDSMFGKGCDRIMCMFQHEVMKVMMIIRMKVLMTRMMMRMRMMMTTKVKKVLSKLMI